MNMSNQDFSGIMEVDKDDLLSAMKKLSKMISSEKQFDIDQDQQPSQHFSLPSRMEQNPLQHTFAMPRNDSYPQVDLIGNLRSLAQEISHMDNSRDEFEEYNVPIMKSGRHHVNQSMNHSVNQSVNQSVNWGNRYSQYDDFETDRLADRRSSAINRLYEHDSRKKEKIAALQFQRYKEELSTMRQKPEILLHSKIIAEQKQKAPIYERSITIMKQREENINKIKKELQGTRGAQDLAMTFQPDLSCTKRYNYERSRTPQEFTAHVYAWHQKKNEAIQKEQYENITRELSELTFKPKINQKSRNMAEKVHGNQEPVELRLHKQREQLEAKKQSLADKRKPTFKPTLNDKSQILAKQRKTGDKSPRLDKSLNNSIIDSSTILEDNRKSTPSHKRSLTPTLLTKPKPDQDKSPIRSKKVPQKKMNEVGYSPAVDFLLRKFE